MFNLLDVVNTYLQWPVVYNLNTQHLIIPSLLNKRRTPLNRLLTLCNKAFGGGGHAVAKLVEVLRYKSDGRGFDSRWCHWNFSLT